MPIGAFISSYEIMSSLKENPKLGHITTFGGHPVISSSGLATVNELMNSSLIEDSLKKEELIRNFFKNHPKIKEIRGRGLMLALIVDSPETASTIILNCLKKGLILFWLLFEGSAIRITPPLTISEEEIKEGCNIILNELNKL